MGACDFSPVLPTSAFPWVPPFALEHFFPELVSGLGSVRFSLFPLLPLLFSVIRL